MNKKAIITLLITIGVPVICYLILKHYGTGAAETPQKLLLDSVVQKEVNGKIINDSVWHKTGNIRLVNQLGDTVNLHQLKGKPVVIDLFFTHCGSICPRLTQSMKSLQQSFKKGGSSRLKIDTTVVQLISLSIDPESDSVGRLKEYANIFDINPDNWWLLTGNKDSIYNFIFEELKIDKLSEDSTITPDFPHTSRFALLDKNMVQRGRLGHSYNGLDSSSIKILARDIGLLMLEKDKTKRSPIFIKIIDLSWLWLLIAVLIAGFYWWLKNKNK